MSRRGRCVLACVLALTAAVGLMYAGLSAYWRAVYPLKYRESVLAAAEENGLPPSLILAVIHTESGFSPGAVSSAGAVGLMQVTEPTLQWMMMRTGGDTTLTADYLTDPEHNIQVGSGVLALLLAQFESEDTALAAYNAGMGTVSGWLKDVRYSADGITLHTLPYPETANYVKKVHAARIMYQKLYDLA